MALIRAQSGSGRALQWRPMAGVLSTEKEEEEGVRWRLVGVFIAAPLQPPFFLVLFFGGAGVDWGGGADCSSYSLETGG